jgi:dTDP-4-dehydrorhamnose reductase
MKAMILGASGLLGQALMREWNEDEAAGFNSREVDIRDAAAVDEVVKKVGAEWIVLAAAYTDVDGCENHRDLAFAVNRDGAVNVAKAARQMGSRLLFLSSDYVFDGRKTTPYEVGDVRNPQSVYGRSKAEAELQLLDLLPDCCIVRTSWLFGAGGRCFPDTILKAAVNRPTLDVVNDQRGCPTYTNDLAKALVQLCRMNANGIVHATNAGDCSWFEFAREIVSRAGLPAEVRPCNTERMARPAARPAYSVLSPASLQKYGVAMPPWHDALKRYLSERRA